MFDFNTIAEGPAEMDVGYFLALSMEPEIRRKHCGALLRHYYDECVRLGVKMPPFEVFAYRVSLGAVFTSARFAMLSFTDSMIFDTTDPNGAAAKFVKMMMSRGTTGCKDFHCAEALRLFVAKAGENPSAEEARQ